MLVEKTRPDDRDFDMTNLAALRDDVLIPSLGRLRDTDPVYWSEVNRCWQVTTHEAVVAAFQDVRFSNVRFGGYAFRSIPEAERERRIPDLLHYSSSWIVNVDGDAHKRLRIVTTKALSKKFVDSLRPLFQSLAAELTEKAVRLKECDFQKEIAYYLPATVILNLLGLPLMHLDKVREWNRAITGALSAPFAPAESLETADRAIAEMNAMLRIEIAKRREAPKEDLLTQLITLADDENKALTEEEVLGICHILLTAGHETTVNSLVFGLIAFARNPDQREAFLKGTVDPLIAMQEMSRYVAMSSMQPRVAGTDFEFHGKQIKKGDVVFLWVISANNDPKVFKDPRQFDVTRPNVAAAATFGPGIHHCIGHYLARVELAVFFETFLPRFSKIEILDDPLPLLPNLSFRGLDHLNVRLTPVAQH